MVTSKLSPGICYLQDEVLEFDGNIVTVRDVFARIRSSYPNSFLQLQELEKTRLLSPTDRVENGRAYVVSRNPAYCLNEVI